MDEVGRIVAGPFTGLYVSARAQEVLSDGFLAQYNYTSYTMTTIFDWRTDGLMVTGVVYEIPAPAQEGHVDLTEESESEGEEG